MKRTLCLFAIAVLATTPALADPTGSWSFETKSEIKGCTISGNMTIGPEEAEGERACSFISQETCENIPDEVITIDQICRVRRHPVSKSLIINSQVAASLTEDYSVANYLPDNFNLDSVSKDKMTGMWWDTNFSAPVIFWREKAKPSS